MLVSGSSKTSQAPIGDRTVVDCAGRVRSLVDVKPRYLSGARLLFALHVTVNHAAPCACGCHIGGRTAATTMAFLAELSVRLARRRSFRACSVTQEVKPPSWSMIGSRCRADSMQIDRGLRHAVFLAAAGDVRAVAFVGGWTGKLTEDCDRQAGYPGLGIGPVFWCRDDGSTDTGRAFQGIDRPSGGGPGLLAGRLASADKRS